LIVDDWLRDKAPVNANDNDFLPSNCVDVFAEGVALLTVHAVPIAVCSNELFSSSF
jgi:hypothetical protein